MDIINEFLFFLGGITVFLLGLSKISESASGFSEEKSKNFLLKCSSSPLRGIATGATVTALVQSSIATNVVAVGLVDGGILSFYSASAIIMGANIGTTATAQIVALSGVTAFDITALGSLSAFIGALITFLVKNGKNKTIGGVLIGFGLLFIGLEIMSDSVNFFKDYEFFKRLFLVENPVVLFLNGLVLTAVMQSSSALSGIMIILAGSGLLSFKSSMFILYGANVGTCLPVIISSLGKSDGARRTAVFNLFFNVFGVLVFFLPTVVFGDCIARLFLRGKDVGRAIANFHTAFNVSVTALVLPILKPFTALISKMVSEERKNRKILIKKQISNIYN